jgi:hypothetical protein
VPGTDDWTPITRLVVGEVSGMAMRANLFHVSDSLGALWSSISFLVVTELYSNNLKANNDPIDMNTAMTTIASQTNLFCEVNS